MMNSIRLFFFVILASGTIIACSSDAYKVTLNDNVLYAPYPITDPGFLNDANLQGCLNQVFVSSKNNDPMQVTSLVCFAAEVKNLIGISALANLEQLELSDNKIQDLGPLFNLKKLKVLSIRNNQLLDIDTLNGMPALRYISLQGNEEIPCRQLDKLSKRLGSSLNSPLNCR